VCALLFSLTSLRYDVCVVATGSRYAAPFKFGGPGAPGSAAAREQLRGLAAQFRALPPASVVCVVGGGAVGVETAAAVKTYHRGLRVLLVARQIVESESEAFRRRVLEILTARVGIECLLGSRVSGGLPEAAVCFAPDARLELEDGRSVTGVSCVVTCTGARPNSEPLRALAMDARGQVEVDDCFRVRGTDGSVLCLGDVCSHPSPKLGYIAARYHAPVVAKNVLAVLRGRALSSYSAPLVYVFGTSLGPLQSVFQVGWFVVEQFLAQKARDLYTAQTWEEVGLKIPSLAYRNKPAE
jgi:pyruvate/2-oxoglutarate dehydrogenase complex dihydrolipoamide dehydrogenase (E3) component